MFLSFGPGITVWKIGLNKIILIMGNYCKKYATYCNIYNNKQFRKIIINLSKVKLELSIFLVKSGPSEVINLVKLRQMQT